jgi:dipeptidyl aminopeptidase/acylaminoacyl peptidase
MNHKACSAMLAIALALLVVGCSISDPSFLPSDTTTTSPDAGVPTGTLCPAPTPELLAVEPVTSPTDRLSQIVTVRMGNMEAVTITAESGVFVATGQEVAVALLPDTVHHLHVVARVREIWRQGCRFGGYTLQTRRDRNGGWLIIQQGRPASPAVPGAVISPGNVSQLRSLFALVPDARATADFVFGSDSEILSVGYAKHISRWSLVTGQESGRLGEGSDKAAALRLAINPDRTLVATGGTADDRSVRLWDMATGEMQDLGRQEDYLESVAFSPGGTRLAGGGNGNKVWIWNVATGRALASFEGDVPDRFQAFHDLVWLDEETLLAAASDAFFWWNVSTGQLLERLARPDKAAFFVDASFGQRGDRLAAVAQDENVYFWDREAGDWEIWPAQPGIDLSHVEFSPDGGLLAATTFEGELLLWDVEARELLGIHSVTTGAIVAVRFSPDGRYLAVGGGDSPIWVWGIP